MKGLHWIVLDYIQRYRFEWRNEWFDWIIPVDYYEPWTCAWINGVFFPSDEYLMGLTEIICSELDERKNYDADGHWRNWTLIGIE